MIIIILSVVVVTLLLFPAALQQHDRQQMLGCQGQYQPDNSWTWNTARSLDCAK